MSLCLDPVRVMCVADHMVRLTGLLPTFLHTAKTGGREATLHSINFTDISDRPGFMLLMGGWAKTVNRDCR